MNKICTKMAGILFANKPKVHFVLPKSLNLYFKDSINPEFKFFNLNNIASIEFNVKEDKESNLFSLVANIVDKNSTSFELVVAKFKEEKNANSALDEIRVKLYAPNNSFVKMGLSIIIAILVFGMTDDFLTKISNSLSVNTPVSEQVIETKPVAQAQPTPQPLLGVPQGGVGSSSKDIQVLIDQLQQLKAIQDQAETGEAAEIQPVGTVQAPLEQELSPSDKLLQGLN